MYKVLLALACITFLSLNTHAESPKGRQLFISSELGSNGKSCQSCHAAGKGLDKIVEYDSETLQGIINICIEDALKGKPMEMHAEPLMALEAYLRSFVTE